MVVPVCCYHLTHGSLAKLRKATVRQVVAAHRHNHKIDLAFKSITILACITMAITLILLAAV